MSAENPPSLDRETKGLERALRSMRVQLAAALVSGALVSVCALVASSVWLGTAPLHTHAIVLSVRQHLLPFALVTSVAIALIWRALHVPALRRIQGRLVALEQELERRERLALVASSTSNAVVITDFKQNVEWINEAFTRLSGHGLAELHGTSMPRSLYAEETPADVITRIAEATERGESFREQVALRGRDGARHWLMVDGQPLRAHDGKLNGYMAVYSDFTGLVEMERLLRKQAQRYDVAMMAAKMGVWDWNIQTNQLEYDGHQFALFGIDPLHIATADKDWRKRVLPEDLPPVEESLKTALRGVGSYNAQFRIRRDDGALRWLQGTGVVISDAKGKPVRMVGTNMDVTDRHVAEEARRQLHLRLQKLTENLPGVLYQFKLFPDGSSCFPYASAGLEAMFGISPDALTQDSTRLFSLIHPEDAARIHLAVRDSARTLTVFSQDYRILRQDGSLRWLRAHATPYREADGSTVWFGVILDSSVIKEAQRREREASASLEMAQTLARLGSWSLDLDTNTVDWSPQMYTLLGRDPALGPPAYGGARSAAYVDEDAEWLHHAMQRAISEGAGFSGTVRLRSPHDGVAVLRAEARVLKDSAGKTTRIYGTVMDITASVERERALQQAQIAAESASRAKTDFLANMSHEIRTPMAAILGYVDLLAEPDVSREQLASFVETIQRNAQHLLELINQVLDLSKIEVGAMTVERIVCSPSAIARELVSLMRPRAVEKGLSLVLRFDGPIPATIESDPLRLRQILLNLVGNAIKFTSTGEVQVLVKLVQSEPASPLLELSVKDTGIGIDASQLPQLFRPFSQADNSTTRRFGGTGLGLSIANHLARLLGGGITVDSTPGVGTTFKVRIATGRLDGIELRDRRDEAEDQAAAVPSTRPLQAALPLTNRHVLLVEDGNDNQRLISLRLTRAGASVDVLANGELAVERLATKDCRHYDAVLMDMQMPVLDGYAATRKLRSLGYRGRIIALTAHAMEGDRKKCLEAGCDDYLTKPLDHGLLVSALATEPASTASKRPLIFSSFQDDPDMLDLIEMFVGSLVERAELLEQTYAAGDLTTLSTIAHQLKGAGGGYGFPQVTHAAQQLEAAIRSRAEPAQLIAALEELTGVCRSARFSPASAATNAEAPQTT